MSGVNFKESNRLKLAGQISTLIIIFVIAAGGVADLLQFKFPLGAYLGIPWFIYLILGTAKELAVATFLTSRFPILREWAYAGLTFLLLGAIVSEVLSKSPFLYALAPLGVLSCVLISYFWWHRKTVKVK